MIGAVLEATLVLAGVAIGHSSSTAGIGSVAQQPSIGADDSGGSGVGQIPVVPGGGQSGTTGQPGTAASSTAQRGIVTIVSVLGYANARSAGTGMILTSDGEILTNNHVINGATSVSVTVESTGKSYRADVVGTAPSNDVAILQLRSASGLTPAAVGDAGDVDDLALGDQVTGVGNAGGTGDLTAVTGEVTALEQSITASDDNGQNAEQLTGLIQTDANVVAGDSGGPLYDADSTIVGINTAGSSGNGGQSGTAAVSYAIPIDDALQVADQIEAGTETSSVHIGLPAFIGVGVAEESEGGVGITSVLADGPADRVGITVGSIVTEVGGKAVTSPASLKTRLGDYEPGQTVSISWTDAQGQSHTASVELVSGPAD